MASLNISKNGILNGKIIEPFITLSDGSKWQLLLYHYINSGANLFTADNAGYCNLPGLYSRLNWIDSFILNSKYEFYAIQDGTVYRWSQTNAPLTTTTITGYTAITGTPGGLCKCSGNTLLARSNSTSNWWNACGCWTNYSGGIPGLGAVKATKSLALYVRISTPKTFAEDNMINGGQIYEY